MRWLGRAIVARLALATRALRPVIVLATVRTLSVAAVLARCIIAVASLAIIVTVAARATRRTVLVPIIVARAIPIGVAINLPIAVARVLFARSDRFTLVIVVVIVAVEVEGLLAARLVIILEPAPRVGKDAEIMIRILQVIFDVDAIATHLRITGEVLVLFVQLVRIAPRPTVDAITAVGAAPTAAASAALARIAVVVPAPAATATVLPIVDQAIVLSIKTKTGLAPGYMVQPSGRRGERATHSVRALPRPPDCSGIMTRRMRAIAQFNPNC